MTKNFDQDVADSLSAAGIAFDREVPVSGTVLDFVARAPDGRSFVIEVKNWQPNATNLNRAVEQAARYKDATHANGVFVVLPGSGWSPPAPDVLSTEQLVAALHREFARHEPAVARSLQVQTDHRTIFAAMPFEPSYDDVYMVAMRPAAEALHAVCTRVDHDRFTGDVVTRMRSLIDAAAAVIVDVSGANANVMYEAGFAHGVGRPAVHICSTPLAELPFDVRTWNTIEYGRGRTHALREPLEEALRAALSGG